MDKKKEKKLEWLSHIEQYAKEKNLSARILDSIEECKNKIEAKDADWKVINREIEELLDSIEKKTVPAVLKAENKENEISVQAVETQLKRMAQRCHMENEGSINSIEERKSMILKNLYIKLSEITRTKAHLDELKNEELYIQFYQKQKEDYEKNVFGMMKELLEDISNNYGHLIKHMRSMFQSIGGHKDGVGNERFYYEHEERKLGLKKKLQGEIETLEVGGSDIETFRQKTRKDIKKIVRKSERLRKVLIWAPLLILFCSFMVNAVINQEKNREIVEGAATEEQLQEDDSPLQDMMLDIAKESGEQLLKSVTVSQVKTFINVLGNGLRAFVIAVGSVAIFILLLIIVVYITYLKLLKVWYNNRICRQCGDYLQKEINSFEQNNNLITQMDDAVKTIVDEYEQQYLLILNNLISGTKFDPNNAEKKEAEQFAAFREEWNVLKYE